MLHKADFFQEQINQCRRLAAQASNKNDREFWLKMTQRWEGLLVGRPSTAPERVEKIIFARARRFANRYRAAYPPQRQCGCPISSSGNLAKFTAISNAVTSSLVSA